MKISDIATIEIPSLQRDYVLGNDTNKIMEFIYYLYNGLLNSNDSNHNNVDLNFIYGVKKDDNFIPIDGQQRLTTLWLLKLYLKALLKEKIDQSLVYKTREYAQDFCEALKANSLDIINKQNGDLVNIEDCPWFIDAWRYDVTVKACINTLNIIHKIHNEFKCDEKKVKARKLLENLDKITCEIREIEDVDSNELYIKLNARGLPLTPYENFKAWLDGQLDGLNNAKLKEDWQNNIDNKWTELVWQNLKNKEQLDNAQLRLFYNILCIYLYLNRKDVRKDDLIAKLKNKNIDYLSLSDRKLIFDDNKNELFEFIASSYDRLCDNYEALENLQLKEEYKLDNSERQKLYFNENNNTSLFEHIFLSNDVNFEKLALAYAVICYHENDFYEYMYCMRNLILHTEINDKNVNEILISIGDLAEKLIKNGNCNDNILHELKSFSQKQIEEERIKLRLKNTHIYNFMRNLENHPFFIGKIKFMFDFCGTDNIKKENFTKYATAMSILFNKDGIAVNKNEFYRALLACSTDDYGFAYKKGSNWNFLYEKGDVKKFISDGSHNASLKNLIDEIDKIYERTTKSSLLSKSKGELLKKIKKISKDKYKYISDWRKLFQHIGAWKYMQQKNARWIDNEIYLIKRRNKVEPSYINAYVYDLYLELKGHESIKNKYDIDIRPQHYNNKKNNIKFDTCLYIAKGNYEIDIAHAEGSFTIYLFDITNKNKPTFKEKVCEKISKSKGDILNNLEKILIKILNPN